MSRRIIILVTVACLALGSMVSAQADSTCDTTIDNGLHAVKSMTAKDYATASDQYACALALYPLDPELHLGMAESAILSGRYTDSWAPYVLLVNYFPDVVQARVDELNTLVAQNPNDIDLLLLQATNNLREGYYSDADQAIDSVLAIDPSNAYGNILKAESLGSNGDVAGFRTYATAARYASNTPYVLAQLANDYDQYLNETDTAIDLISRAIADSPNDADFRALYAYFLDSRKDNPKAAAVQYRQALDLGIDNVNVLIGAATTFIHAGDHASSDEALDRLSELLPAGSRDLYVTRAYVADADKDPLTAAEAIDAYAHAKPDTIVEGGELESGVTSTEAMVYDREIVYTISLSAGDTVTLQASSLDGQVDPMVSVVDSFGHGVAFNDDYDATENYDAQLTFTAADTDTYTIWVTHAGAGSYGDVTTTATVESAAPAESTDVPAETATPELTAEAGV